jgi:peptidoglycan/xylan/chitin deacetylase (PgdA/CDA1 family)
VSTRILSRFILFAFALPTLWQAPARRVAITFDDLPLQTRLHASNIDEQRRIVARLVSAIGRHHVPAIGFVNEGKLYPNGRLDPRRVPVLKQWIDARLELGNHSFSHFDLHTTSVDVFEADVARGDSITRRLLNDAGRPAPRWFRHPFLHTGRDTAIRSRFERFLAQRGYRVAPVTMDNYDYMFNVAYEQALGTHDSTTARRVVSDYLTYMTAIAAYYEQQSVALVGREIPQVLLLHSNRLNADTFDALAAMFQGRGYSFVPLEEAVSDPSYRMPDRYDGPAGITWLHRWALTAGKHGSFFAGEPTVPDYIQRAAGGN